MAGGSDLDALQGGFRARALLLGLVLVGGLGAALWSGTRQHGEGEPESRARLMVVSAGAEVDYYRVLERAGFEIAVDSYEDWLATARSALPESEAEGVPLLIEHADIEGIGYVVLESPASYSLADLEIDIQPDPASIEAFDTREYAVLSVGDLAFPHHLSVDPLANEGPELVRLPGFGALEAVFEQPTLLVREDDERPTVEELHHEDAIKVGARMVGKPAEFAAAIAASEATIAAELAVDPEVRLLVPEGEAGTAVPMPDGSVLVIHHPIEIYSRDANRLELQPAATLAVDYIGMPELAEFLDGGELKLEPCTSLAGGSLSLDDRPQLEAAADGSALAITTLEGGTELWHWAHTNDCEWRSLGVVEGLGEGRVQIAPGPPSPEAGLPSLALIEVGVNLEGLDSVRAWSLAPDSVPTAVLGEGELEPGPRLVQSELFRLEEGQLGRATFLDRNHVALLSSTALPVEQATNSWMREDVIHILDCRAPGAHLRVPTAFFAEETTLHEIAMLEPAKVAPETSQVVHGPRLLLTASRAASPLQLLVLEIGAEAWADFITRAPAEAELEGASGLFTLTPEDLASHRLDTGEGDLRLGLSASEWVVAWVEADRRGPSEVAYLGVHLSADVVDPESWTQPKRATQNALVDRLPRVVPQIPALTFSTQIKTELSTRTYSVPRITTPDSGSSD